MAGSFKTNNRKPYNGDRRALVLAFDVGTTFSGVSYAFLDPGEVPKIHGVTRYPGQEHVTGNTKIPSLLYYDRNGRVVAAGAEAERGQVADEAEDEGWFKVELFKLRLRPRRMELDMNGMRFSPLPPGKSSEDVFGDFLAYLFSCTRKFIEDTHANGKNLWRAIEKDIHFVLSHPNGWEGAQQTRMRRAAISGGLISNTDEGKARIRFVTEGEASMHACILSGLAHDVLASGNGFIVADAGGGTLDVSSYILRGTHPLQIEEVAPPDCVFAGAVFVSRRCRVFLEEKLRTSKYGTPETLDHITKRFDETTKRLFRDKNDVQYIPFGSPLDKDPKVGIRTGQLRLTGAEVAELFEPSIQSAVASVRKQVELARGTIKAVWLVGGFAASPWLFSQLKHRLKPLGVTVNRPDNQTSKAVADGAIGFFCDHHVSARMSRYMYGVEYLREIDVNDEEHVTRSGRQLQLPSGPKYLPDAFDCILAKNVRVKESSVFSRKYYTEVTKLGTLSVFEIEIWCYRGGETIPKWIDRNSDNFGSLCYVRADLSRLSSSAAPKKGANGQTYWTVVFSIEIHFGLTEFKARMKWNEDGKTKYGPATIVFNEKGVRSDEDDDAYSVAGGDESMAISPRRPYGSLLSHSSREPSTTTRSSRHRERDRDRGMHREHVHNPPAPPLTGTGVSRSMSGQTDATSVETITREPSPPPAARPIVSSVSSSSRSRGKSRGLGSSVPSAHALESEPALERELEPSSPSIHSRAPSMHSHAPSAVGAPMSMHSRAPSAAAPPSVHSRTPSVAASPSMHSRAPSAIAPPSMHSRAPSAAAAPSIGHYSRAPSAAVASSPVPSRAPSIAQAPSRAPSFAAAPSPVPSRTSSALGRPSLSRAPSTGSRVPTVTRAPSARSGYGSRAPSQMAPVDEGDLYVPTEPDLNGSAAEYYNSAPSGELDAVQSRPRSISPAPQADLDAAQSRTRSISPAPPAAEEPHAPPSKRGSWELPSVPEAPPHEEKKGWGFGGGWGWGGGKPTEDATGPSAAPGDVPLETFEQAEEQFIPPAPGADSWDQFAAPPPAPGGWNDEFLPPVGSEPIPAPPEEPEITAPPIAKTSSKTSKGGKSKKGKGILKNGSAAAEEAEAKAKAEAEAEVLAQAEHDAREKAAAEAEALAREHEEAEAQAKAEEEERTRKREEEEALAREMNAKNSKGGKNKKGKGILKNGSAVSRATEEAEAQAQAEAEALARAENEAREREEAEAFAQEQQEAEAFAREQQEAEAQAKAEEEERARKREEEEALARETNAKNSKGGKGKKGKGAMKNGSAASKATEEAEAKAKAEAEAYERAEAEARAKAEEDEFNRQLEEEEARLREQASAAEHARIQAEAEETARLNAEAQARAEDEQAESEARSRAEAEAQAAAQAEAKTKAEEEAVAKAKADAEAEELTRTKAMEDEAEAEKAGATVVDAPAEPETAPAAESAPAVDEEKTKLEAAVEKAEADVAKAEEEFNNRGVALAKIPKPRPKKGKKGPTGSSAAEKAAERELAVAEKSFETAKGKLEKAKAALDAYVPPAAVDPPAPTPPPEEPAAAESAPPISKVSSTASGKGKKTNMFDFGAFGNDNKEEGEDNGDGEAEGEKTKESDGLGLFGGGGSSWGFSSPFGGGKAGSKAGSGWAF